MKFGKNLSIVVDISDPEWGPFWINYKLLKKKINDIINEQGGEMRLRVDSVNVKALATSPCEIEFFRALQFELKKATDFFDTSENIFRIRLARVKESYRLLTEGIHQIDNNSWKMLLSSCLKLYKEALLLENFAIMNYCGFSKILKKHDKMTGFSTREAFMKKVVSKTNFAKYPFVLECIQESEKLFKDVQAMESTTKLHDEEKLFIEAIRDLNYQAIRLQTEERESNHSSATSVSDEINSKPVTKKSEYLTKDSKLFPSTLQQSSANEMGTALDKASSKLIDVSAKVSQNSLFSPNIAVALSWMEGITRKDGASGGIEENGSGTDVEDLDNLVIIRKRKVSEDAVNFIQSDDAIVRDVGIEDSKATCVHAI